MSKVGIIGGTFNPIHIGHLRLAEAIAEAEDFFRILFVPSFEPPLKSKELASYTHRLNMVNLAIEGNQKFWVSIAEQDLPTPSYTFNLLKQLTSKNPDRDYTFILGMECWYDLEKWYKFKELLGLCDFTFVTDTKCELESDYLYFGSRELESQLTKVVPNVFRHQSGTKIKFIVCPTPSDISSTKIRGLCQQRKSCRYLVPEPVFKYIEEQKLYAYNV
jgi:nicotinate-nucleotide adenylyltransferase